MLEPESLWWHPGDQQKRKIVLDPSGSMNIYLVLDGSDSIGARNFTGAKNCLKDFIEKVEPPPSECGDPDGPRHPARTNSLVFLAPLSHRVPENLWVLSCPPPLLPEEVF